MRKELRPEVHNDYSQLNEAFRMFSETTQKLQEGYSLLEEKVAYLSKELEMKNTVLEKNVVALDKTKKYLKNILENVSDGVMALDLDGHITTFNKAAQTITNYNAEEIINKRYDEILVTKGEGKNFIKDVIREITLLAGHETSIKNKQGGMIPVVAYTAPITDEHSCVIGIVITFNDVSRIKQLEREVEGARRLAALGEMAAGVAHEIRNPLGGIEMFASLLERECASDERKKGIAHNISEGVRSLNKIVTGLLTFTRSLKPTDYGTIDFIDVVESSLRFTQQEVTAKNIVIEKKYNPALSVAVQGDRDQLQQVLLNIILNAVQAVEKDTGVITITCMPIPEDGYVVIEVADNGYGIKLDALRKIFDPFFTTKDSGTGLGLAISYRIVEAHGGKITVKSIENEKTQFSVYLPLA